MLGKTSASPRICGTRAARSSGTNIVLNLRGQGWAWGGLEATAQEQGRWSSCCSTWGCGGGGGRWRVCLRHRRGSVSATWAGSAGVAGQPGPDQRPGCWAQGGAACLPSGSRFSRLHGGGGVAVDDWSKYLHYGMANRGRKRKIRKNQQEIRSD